MCTLFNRIVRNMVRALNKLSDLRQTKYGQPPPRHGLNLLWWFAHYCVQIDSNGQMTAQCNPANGALAFIGSIIGMIFFLKWIYHTMRWATWTTLVHCLIMSQRITLDIQTKATKIASLFPLSQGGEDLRMFMWHSTQIRCTLTRIAPTALALIFWRTLKSWAVKNSSEDARLVLNIYP